MIAIDFGGSYIRGGRLPDSGSKPIIKYKTPENREDILQVISSVVSDLANGDYTIPIGVASPGLVSPSGFVNKALYADIGGCALQESLTSILGRQVFVFNDVNTQALGALHSSESMLCISLGTGVGGAVIDRGRLLVGAHGFTGEIGHLQVSDSTGLCDCGMTKCLDLSASGYWLVRKHGDQWWKDDSPNVRTSIFQAGRAVARAAISGIVLLDVDRIVIVGKLTNLLDFKQGFDIEWQTLSWDAPIPEFVTDSWPFSARGLSKLILQKREEKEN